MNDLATYISNVPKCFFLPCLRLIIRISTSLISNNKYSFIVFGLLQKDYQE